MKDIKQLKTRIGENLFKIRRSKNLSIHQASILLSIKKSKLDALERGSKCMNFNTLLQYANAYGVDMALLFK